MLRVAIISNELPPYRVPFFQRLSCMPGLTLQVLFCTRREPNRLWELPPLNFDHHFLHERMITLKGRYIHNNPGVIAALHRFSPDIVVTGGFNPTHLYAFAYALARKLPHIPMTDGTVLSERGLSKLHKMIRRVVYGRSQAFISASAGGQRLYENYGISAAACFRSCLCIDNAAFSPHSKKYRKLFDFLFCGRFEEVKNPLFALEVALATAKKLGRKTSILFIGAGAQEQALRTVSARHADLLHAEFHGFIAHASLPSHYHSARLFLFPSRWDPWGVVANEACAAGLPIIVSPEPGVAGELVIDGRNGFVCPFDIDTWAERACQLLTQSATWERFSQHSLNMIKDYTYDHSAAGFAAACRYALPIRTTSSMSTFKQ